MRVGPLSHAFLLPFADPGRFRDDCPGARETTSPVPRRMLVAALASILFAVIASSAAAAVVRASERDMRAHAAAGACPGADLRPTDQDLGRIRSATLCLVNRERARRGERPLAPNRQLGRAAQAHTDSMASGGYLGHDGPRGESPGSRIRATGYVSSSRGGEVGENIAWGTLGDATPRAIVAAWMDSPGHRANILDPRFRDTGVGVVATRPSRAVRGGAGAIYTQDFGD